MRQFSLPAVCFRMKANAPETGVILKVLKNGGFMKKQKQLDVKNYKSKEGFVYRYQKLVKDTVVPYQYAVLNDAVEGVAKSHVIANFENAAKAVRGEDVGDGFYGMVFQDSDAAKWIEAAAYSLVIFPDEDLEKKVDELILKIEAAQDADGYLNTYYTIKDKEKRWTNLLEGHELYCSGHMMEAAVAYYEATGKDRLLKVMQKNAAHIYQHFIVEGHEGYPGHPEVELALLRMYQATKDRICLELAEHFINVRGVDNRFYEKELAKRNWQVWGNDASNADYQQSGKPVREQKDATGHSVRAVYLYTGMADLAAVTEDEELAEACRRLWESITERRMYVTGGIGSTVEGEAFTVDYDLPNETAYAETCASIGLMFFASRMLEMEADSKYADVMERAFYNTVLAGMQLDGKRFFYVNPLEVLPGISGVIHTHRHDLPERPGWYACACCPPNAARLIASFGKYAYSENAETSFVHLYAEGEVSFENGMKLKCETEYPYGFTITYRVISGGKTLALRIPDWSSTYSVTVNAKEAEVSKEKAAGEEKMAGAEKLAGAEKAAGAEKLADAENASAEMKKGYLYLSGLRDGDVVTLKLDDAAKRIYTSTKVAENTGAVALQRGPLIYCVEGADNEGDVLSLSFKEDGEVTAGEFLKEELMGCIKLQAEGYRTQSADTLYSMKKPEKIPCTITAVPYYTWGNRGINQMRVWLPE